MIIIFIFIILFIFIYILIQYINPHTIISSLKYLVPNNLNEFLDKEIYFPDHKILEDNFKQIQEECSQILKTYNQNIPEFKDIDENQSTICKQGKWRMFMLRLFNKNLPNSSLTPNTIKLINKCSNIRNAFFSILEPNSYLPPHHGEHYSIFRYHLPLLVPNPDLCKLTVNNKEKEWKEGEGFMFDDTFMHSATNNSNSPRVILFLDIERNDMNLLAKLIDFLINELIKYHPKYKEAILKSEPKQQSLLE